MKIPVAEGKSAATLFVDRLLRGRWLLLGFWLGTVVLSATVYIADFRIDNSVGIWFRQDDPQIAEFEQFNRDFGPREWTFVLLETASIEDPGFLRDLDAMGRQIQSLAHVERVLSIANVRDSVLEEDGMLNYRRLFPGDAEPLTDARLQPFLSQLRDNPIFVDNLYRDGDHRHTVLLIQNDNLLRELAPYRMQLVDAVRQIIDQYPSVEHHALAGTTVLNAELNRSARRDMLVYYGLISLMLVLGGRLFLPGYRDLLVLLPVVVGSVVPTLGLISLSGIPFNMVTIMLPTILVSIGVSLVVHLLNEFHHERRRGPLRPALSRTLSALVQPAFWTSLTTILGFLALATSAVEPIRQLGLFGALGIVLSGLWTFTLAPVLLNWIDRGQTHKRRRRRSLTRPLVHGALHLVERHPRQVLAAAALLVAGLGGLLSLQADTDYVGFFRQDSTLRADYGRLESSGFPQYYVSLVLDYADAADATGEKGYAADTQFAATTRLETALAELPAVRKILSAAQLLREADRAMTGERASWTGLGSFGSQRVGQLLLMTEASGNRDLTDLVTGDRYRTQLIVMTDYLSSKALNRLRRQITALAGTVLPENVGLTITGTSVLWANMDADVIDTQFMSLGITGAALILLLPLVLRSWRLGALGILVSFLPIACTLALMAWFDIRVNLATCLIGAIAVGVAVDDTIHFLTRVRLEVRRGRSQPRAIRRAMLVTGNAMLTTSMMLMAGFLTMALSDFLPSALFGGLFAVTVLLALLGDLLLLPVLLHLRGMSRLRGKPRQSASQPLGLPRVIEET